MSREGKNVSRREFIKGTALGAVGVASLGILGACAPSSEPAVAPTAAPAATPVPAPANEWWEPETWDVETDVIVVGTGDAGCPAAIRAFDNGASVIMIDKGEFFGGSSVLGGGNSQLACTHVQTAQGIEDKKEWAYEDTMVFGQYHSNPDVLQAWIDTSEEYCTWAEDVAGIEWAKLGQQEPARVARSHRAAAYKDQPEGSGIVLSMKFYEQLEARKIPVHLQYRMTKLWRQPDGPVLGLQVETPEGTMNMKANKAVILATGGFKGNPQMIRAYHPMFDETLIWSGWPDVYPTGDGHLAAMEVGGGCVDMSYIMEFSGRLGTRQYVRWERPHFEHKSTSTGLPNKNREHIIFVENSGNRYLNEIAWEAGHTLPWTEWMIAFLKIKGRPRMEWMVTDQDGADDIGWTAFEDAFVNPDETKTPCCEPGWVAKADTIAELADQMGVPADALEATIARWNEMVDKGTDEEFGRPGPFYKILNPPFWGARWCRMAHDQCTGIRVNQHMQVVDQSFQWMPESGDSVAIGEERVIPHLYAAGESTGGTGGAVRGPGKRGWYQVHGYIAGAMAAKEEPTKV